jgi:hypothetical protein
MLFLDLDRKVKDLNRELIRSMCDLRRRSIEGRRETREEKK